MHFRLRLKMENFFPSDALFTFSEEGFVILFSNKLKRVS
jgi:hypothetical protein